MFSQGATFACLELCPITSGAPRDVLQFAVRVRGPQRRMRREDDKTLGREPGVTMRSQWTYEGEILAADAVTVDAARIAHEVRHQCGHRSGCEARQILESAHAALQKLRPVRNDS